MNQLSHTHSKLTLNGTSIEGLAPDDVPVELPDIVLAETQRGRDGTMYANGTGARGGEVMVKLHPTSRSAKFLLRKHAEIQAGAVIEWEGSWEDSHLGYSTLLRGGVMISAPAGVMPGKNAEFTFDFEECVPQYDAANFSPAPTIST